MKVDQVIEKIEHLPKFHEKNDLSYIKKVLDFLDNPQDKVKTIHVTGTNGKGSTSYYLNSLLKKAGLKTGLFVSPYIKKFNERIQISGYSISNELLIKSYQVINKAINTIKVSDPNFNLVTFEFETAMAFWVFANQNCKYAVIEVGIGGKNDKTNVINPEVSIITTIGLDHEKLIGPTIKDIAKEKSGVIKYQKPVVLGNIPEEVLPIIKNKAKSEKSNIYQLGYDFNVKSDHDIFYTDKSQKLSLNLKPQVESYDIAIALFSFSLLNLHLSKNDKQDAINQVQVPGRYQIISQAPMIILDGAHNFQALSNLLEFVKSQNQGKIYYLLGIMKDKNLAKIFSLFNETDDITLTRIDYPRAAKLDDFPEKIRNRVIYLEDYKEAFKMLVSKLKENDTLVVTGSFYLVGALLNNWEVINENKIIKPKF